MYVLLSIATGLLGLGWGFWQFAWLPKRQKLWKERFRRIVRDIDALIFRLNHIVPLLHDAPKDLALDALELTVIQLHHLLEALVDIQSNQTEQRLKINVEAAYAMIQACDHSLNTLYERIVGHTAAQGVDALLSRDDFYQALGCFFCSHPHDPQQFALTPTKVQAVRLYVYACGHCHQVIKDSGKAHVLYFKLAGKAVHWTQVPRFKTKPEYWQLNRVEKPLHPDQVMVDYEV